MADMIPTITDRQTGDYRERAWMFDYTWDAGDQLVNDSIVLRVPEGLLKTVLRIRIADASAGTCVVTTYLTDDPTEVAFDSWAVAEESGSPYVYTIRNARRIELTLATNDSDFGYDVHAESTDN